MENELPLLYNDLKRNNEDKCLNTYGKPLLELIIVNGRIGDNLSGKFTCKGLSTVDYFLCDFSIAMGWRPSSCDVRRPSSVMR